MNLFLGSPSCSIDLCVCFYASSILFGGGFPAGAMVKNVPTNAGDPGDGSLTPGSRRSHGEGNGNPLQYSCLENSMDRGTWQATVPGLKRELDMTCTRGHTHTLFWCLRLCSIAWHQRGWFLQLCSFFSRLVCLLGVFCVSIENLKLFVLVLWKMLLVFW